MQDTRLDTGWISRTNVDPVLRDRAKQLRREGTPSERKLWNCLRKKQLEGRRFRRQHPIECFIVDFICLQEGLVIEVDGGIHLLQEERDAETQTRLEQMGLRIIRFSNEEIEHNLPQVLEEIKRNFMPIPQSESPLPSRSRGKGAGG